MEHFKKQIDEVLKRTYPKNDMLYLCDTPSILQDIGLDNLPITMTQKHLKSIMNKRGDDKVNYHDLGIEIIKKIPSSLGKPIKIFGSLTKDDSIVIVTDLLDKENRPIIAIIKLNGVARLEDKQVVSNIMTSAYGRNNYDEFLIRNIKNEKLIYDINQGIKKRVTKARIQFPRRDNSLHDSISQSNSTVNNSNMQNSNKYSVKETTANYGYYTLEILNYI